MSDITIFSLNFLVVLMECIILYRIGATFLAPVASRFLISAMVLLLTVITFVTTLLFVDHSLLKIALFFIIDTIWLYLCVQRKIVPCLFISVCFIGFMNIADSCIFYLTSIVATKHHIDVLHDLYWFYSTGILAKIIELLLTVIFSILYKQRFVNVTSNTFRHSLLKIALLPSVFTVLSFVLFQAYQNAPLLGNKFLLCNALLLLTDVISVTLLEQLEHQEKLYYENEVLSQSLKKEKENLLAWTEAYDSQRRQTHDFQNHLAVIKAMVQKSSQSQELLSYLNQLSHSECPPLLHISTNRPVADILFNQKYTIANAKKIDFRIQLDDLSHFPLSDDELTVVLGNLLDNALTASSKCDESNRKIKVKMQTSPCSSFLYVENTTIPPKKDHLPSEFLLSPSLHGYGLKNVQRIMESTNATFTYVYLSKDNKFVFSAQWSQLHDQ